jgi:hypothetical protein
VGDPVPRPPPATISRVTSNAGIGGPGTAGALGTSSWMPGALAALTYRAVISASLRFDI